MLLTQRTLPDVSVKNACHLNKRPSQRTHLLSDPDQSTDLFRIRLIDVLLGDVRRIDIHPYRSSSGNRPLSPFTLGILAQTSLRSGALVAPPDPESGLNSATALPRLSITITCSSAASLAGSKLNCPADVKFDIMIHIHIWS